MPEAEIGYCSACSRATAIVRRSRRAQALVQDEPNTNDREDYGKQDAQRLLRNARRRETAKRNARQRPDEERSEKRKIHRTHCQMTEPGNQGERNGVRDIRTDDAHYGKMRIYQDKRRYADRAGAD